MLDNSFNFDNLVNSTNNPFIEPKKRYEADSRFYVLPKDSEGNGSALIMFLLDPDERPIIRVEKFNLNNTVNGVKRFINMYSRQNCGQPDPIQEEWQRLWNANLKEEARNYSRTLRYIANIKILRDPACPENEGKIMLYEMSNRLAQKINQAMYPSEEDLRLETAEKKKVFNPFEGWVFKLSAKKQNSGIISYDSSEFIKMPNMVPYANMEAFVKDVNENGYKLSWFTDPANYPSYEEVAQKLAWLKGEDGKNVGDGNVAEVEINDKHLPEPEVQDATQSSQAPTQNYQSHRASDIDARIDELLQ